MVWWRLWLVGVDSDEEEQVEQPFAGHAFAANLSNLRVASTEHLWPKFIIVVPTGAAVIGGAQHGARRRRAIRGHERSQSASSLNPANKK